MAKNEDIKVLIPELQASFYYRLKTIRELYFHKALGDTVQAINIRDLDKELALFAPDRCLQNWQNFLYAAKQFFQRH